DDTDDALADERSTPPAAMGSPMPLIHRLRDALYARAYCVPFDLEAEAPDAADAAPDPSFLPRLLAAAAPGSARAVDGRMDAGWQVVAADPRGAVTATKQGVTRVFPAGHYAPTAGGLQPGRPLTVWWTRTSLHQQTHFLYLYGAALADAWQADRTVRLYWNLSAEGALTTIGALADRLDRFRVPYQLKTLVDPNLYPRRCDAGVLFFQRRHAAIVLRIALAIADDRDPPMLAEATPLFARRLAPGLALAEDPGTSFGLHRCQLLAEALWNAHAQGRGETVAGQMETIRAHFAARGVDLACPHLNAHASDYPLPDQETGP
ncbi:MAG: T3SS effector HopA1 family protein, partial [Acidobacteriota bacterium]